MGQVKKYAASLLISVILCNCGILKATTLPPWLPWFTYAGNVDDLNQYLKEKVPIGQRNVFLLARTVTIHSDINLKSNYYNQQLPFELTVLCETLQVGENFLSPFQQPDRYTIDLSGDNAPNYVSAPRGTVLYQPDVAPLTGKAGADGGSINLYAKEKRGIGQLILDVSGGDGGKGQDGSRGNDGVDATWLNPGVRGEDGRDGADGGTGGDAGDIVVHSMDNPSSILYRNRTSGGRGGPGGDGGRGGRGGRASSWSWGFPSTRAGRNGDNGPTGNRGESTDPDKHRAASEGEFYRSLPITGNDLQRALNAETYRMMHARYQRGSDKWNKIRSAVTWISEVATATGYDIIQQRCTDMLDLCTNLQSEPTLTNSIHVRQSKIEEQFNNIRQVVEQSVNVDPLQLNQDIQNSELLKEHSSYARSFNYLARRHNYLRERYFNAREVANSLGRITSGTPATTITNFLRTPLAPKLEDKIMSIARKKPYLDNALRPTAISVLDGEVLIAIDAAEIFGGLAVGVEAAPLLGLLGAARVVQAEIESVAVKTVAGRVIGELHEAWGTYFDTIDGALSKYERVVEARAQRNNQNNRQTQQAQARKDEKLKKISPPDKRRQYLQRKRRNWEPPTNGRRGRTPVKHTGRFLGVLEKYDLVETNTNQAVVSFDAIKLSFTVKRGQTVDLNDLGPYQQQEFNTQLESYRQPFGVLPAFIITTTVDKTLINENAVGEWFEFDCVFAFTGTSDAVISSSIVAFIDQLSQMSSLNVDNGIPVTVTSIRQLSTQLQTDVVTMLGLNFIGVQTAVGKKKRAIHLDPFNPLTTCRLWESQLKITKVKVANVGQGSCNLLFTAANPDRVETVLDLGYGKGKQTGQEETTLVDKISEADNIIISHWDMDHYRYLVRNPTQILATRKTYIAPRFGSNTGVTVRRVVTSIPAEQRQLLGVGEYTTNKLDIHSFENIVVNLNLHTTTMLQGRSKNNVGAITVSLVDNHCNPLFLLPGDASYDVITRKQKDGNYHPYLNLPRLKYIVATHHGSTRNIGNIPQAVNMQSEVIYSYGANNFYGHDVTRARPLYTQRGWGEESTTVGSPNGIEITLDLDRA